VQKKKIRILLSYADFLPTPRKKFAMHLSQTNKQREAKIYNLSLKKKKIKN
jgi:hypothetical protein